MSCAVVLNDKSYNYEVDVEGGRLWLEDGETKRQWQWLSEESPTKNRDDHSDKHVPDCVFLAAVQDCFRGDSAVGCVCLEQKQDDTSLRLHVDVRFGISDWRVNETLEFTPIPMAEIDLVRARLADAEKCLLLLQDKWSSAEQELAAYRTALANREREFSDMEATHKCQIAVLSSSAVLVLALAEIFFGPYAIVPVVVAGFAFTFVFQVVERIVKLVKL